MNTRLPASTDGAEVIFDGRFARGWEDWGWGPHEVSGKGPARVKFSEFGGIILKRTRPAPRPLGLAFRFKAPPSYGSFLVAALKSQTLGEETFPRVRVDDYTTDAKGGWKEIRIPGAVLNPKSAPFDRVLIQANAEVGSDWVLLHKIQLIAPDSSGRSSPSARDAKLTVFCDQPSTPINPLIYGIAHGVGTTGETAHRVGGNPMTRLNWDLGNTWNAGSDWFFENVQAESGLWDWLSEAYAKKLSMAVVVPMIGWVAKDGTSVGFPKSKFGSQRKHDPYRPEAGDGHKPDGTALKPGPATLTSVPAPPDMIERWIKMGRDKDRQRGGRSIHMYILDNEPGLWHVTHRDVHPDLVGYDELLERTIRYGSAIRRADPDAVIAGPAAWGWPDYFTSAKDLKAGLSVGPDRLLHGGKPLLAWYLRKLFEHEKRTGVRILDLLDVHYYPQAAGIYDPPQRTDAEGSALRLRATRSLWDSSYKDESWVNDTVRLIPRLKEWIEENYPGRGIVLGEWSFGAEEHISGALAITEALGRFGQHGLHAAFYWAKLREGTAAFQAFRAFRNFDGKGGRFLDLSVKTSDVPGLSLFASRDAARSRLVLVLLNLDATSAARAELDVASCGNIGSVRSFGYTAGNPGLSERPSPGYSQTAARAIVPPHSIAVYDLSLSQP